MHVDARLTLARDWRHDATDNFLNCVVVTIWRRLVHVTTSLGLLELRLMAMGAPATRKSAITFAKAFTICPLGSIYFG
jgi:hypothetical protein